MRAFVKIRFVQPQCAYHIAAFLHFFAEKLTFCDLAGIIEVTLFFTSVNHFFNYRRCMEFAAYSYWWCRLRKVHMSDSAFAEAAGSRRTDSDSGAGAVFLGT